MTDHPPAMGAEERELFATSLRQATGSASGEKLDQLLGEIGWADALATDPRTAVSTLFELQGESGATSAALGTVLLAALGLTTSGDTAVVLPPLGSTDPPGRVDAGADATACVALGGIGLSEMRRRSTTTVIARRGDADFAAVAATSGLAPRSVEGLDPMLELVELAVDCVPTDGDWSPVPGSWADAVAAGQRAIAHEMSGAMRTMLRLAREHTLERIQFGRPIGSFQAVRHRLADSYVAIEATDAALDGAWLDGSPFSAALAKAVAGQSARTVRRHCQQVLAGIGFTTEHDLHRFVRRTMVLDGLLGDSRTLIHQLGADLIRDGHLPRLLPL